MWSLGTLEHPEKGHKGRNCARKAGRPDSSKSNSVHSRVLSDNALVHANTAVFGGSRRTDHFAIDDPTGGLNTCLTEVARP